MKWLYCIYDGWQHLLSLSPFLEGTISTNWLKADSGVSKALACRLDRMKSCHQMALPARGGQSCRHCVWVRTPHPHPDTLPCRTENCIQHCSVLNALYLLLLAWGDMIQSLIKPWWWWWWGGGLTEDAGSSETKGGALLELDGLWMLELLHFTEKDPGRENHCCKL